MRQWLVPPMQWVLRRCVWGLAQRSIWAGRGRSPLGGLCGPGGCCALGAAMSRLARRCDMKMAAIVVQWQLGGNLDLPAAQCAWRGVSSDDIRSGMVRNLRTSARNATVARAPGGAPFVTHYWAPMAGHGVHGVAARFS